MDQEQNLPQNKLTEIKNFLQNNKPKARLPPPTVPQLSHPKRSIVSWKKIQN